MNGVVVLADDLSGAAESAGAFLARALPVTLSLSDTPGPRRDAVTVIDLNTRAMGAADAQRAMRAALRAAPDDALLLKKVDSKLRGHIGAEVDVLVRRGPVIVAAALPLMNRTVRDGVLYLDGVALHEARAWSAETALEPRSVAELFADNPAALIPADAHLTERLYNAAVFGEIAVCDAATDHDLDRIVAAATQIPGAQLVGTAALAAAVARTIPAAHVCAATPPPSERVLVVVGTAEPVATEQVGRLSSHGVRHIELDVDELLSGKTAVDQTATALGEGHVVLSLRGHLDPTQSQKLSAALARHVAAVDAHRPDLVLTGGETARSVIDALNLLSMQPIGQVHHGAVVSIASDGRRIVTRPGSFGGADSLIHIVNYLVAHTNAHPQQKDMS